MGYQAKVLATTRREENKLIRLLESDEIGDKADITLEDKARIAALARKHKLSGTAQDIDEMDLPTFEDYLANTIYG